MSATSLMIWGLVIHLVCDWLLQNEWMALNKMKRRERRVQNKPITLANTWAAMNGATIPGPWWDRHPAAYVHSGIHAAGFLLIFPWPAALALGLSHLLIDTRKPVQWWSKLIRQTQPNPATNPAQSFDIGWDVRIWTDQVFHVAAIALAALILGAVS